MSNTVGSESGRSLLPARPPIPARLALALIGIVIGLLVIEGGVRLRQWIRYGTVHASVYQVVDDPRTGLTIPKPNLDTGRTRIDSRGFRNPEIQMPKPAGRVRLAFLGASTTYCMEVSNNEATWPHLVTQALSERYPGVTFDYINAGVPAYRLPLSRKNLEVRVAPLQPDLVLYYEAFNDFADDTRKVAVKSGLYRDDFDKPSKLARVSTAWYLVEKNLLIRERSKRATQSNRKIHFNPDSLAGGFEARLEEFLRVARDVAPVYAVATFSHKIRREQPPEVQLRACTSSLYYAPYMSVRGLLDGWDAYNRAIRAAARKTGALLIEGEDSIPGDDAHFADSIHFLDPGSKAMAVRVVRGLEASPEFNTLVANRSGQAHSHTP